MRLGLVLPSTVLVSSFCAALWIGLGVEKRVFEFLAIFVFSESEDLFEVVEVE